MKIIEIRPFLKSFFERHLRIDEWGVDMPQNSANLDRPPSIGLDIPADFEVEEIFEKSADFSVQLVGKYEFQFIYRFASIYSYENLPISEFESHLLWMQIVLQSCLQCELEEMLQERPTVSFSYNISRAENKDWLLVSRFSVNLDLVGESFEIKSQSSFFAPTAP